MPVQPRTQTLFIGACLMVLGIGSSLPASAYDPKQSTGPGTVQSEGEIKTERGGHTGEFTSRNESSGSATGEVRDPSNPEPMGERRVTPQHEPKGEHESSQTERGQAKESPNM